MPNRHATLPMLAVLLLTLAAAGPELPTVPDWAPVAPDTSGYFGYSVARAGDVNGDGVDDVIVGAPYSAVGGAVYVYYGASNGLADQPAWSVQCPVAGAEFGTSVACAGDVNGDGHDDVIVGAKEFSGPGLYYEGRAYVYLGSSSGLSATPAWTADGNQSSARFGTSVSAAGDVNRDGYGDIIVGAPKFTGASPSNQSEEGKVFVYYGGPLGQTLTTSWSFESDAAIAALGTSVSCAGDVNRDGYADVIAGAPRYFNYSQSSLGEQGRLYVWYGGLSGLATAPPLIIDGGLANANFGTSVASAGDVNGDGYGDVIVGAPLYTTLWPGNQGRACVFLGSGSGLASTSSWTVDGDVAGGQLGSSVSTAGDVDGDGCDDVIVGAFAYANGLPYEGAAFLYKGSSAAMSTSAAWSIEGELDGALLGSSVATAGDINDDGFADVVVGAPQASPRGFVLGFQGRGLAAAALGQFKVNGSTPLTLGEVTIETGFLAKAVAIDTTAAGALVLEVEVREAGALIPLVTGSSQPVSSGQPASVTVSGLARGLDYQWQGRIRNTVTNATSSWRKIPGSTGAAAEVHFSVRANATPTIASLAQIDVITGAPMAAGAESSRNTVYFRAAATDGDADAVRLQVEVRRTEAPFTIHALESAPGTAPATLTVAGTFPVGAYTWRARTVDVTGEASPWTEFGGAPSFTLFGGSVNDVSCLSSATQGTAGLAIALLVVALLLARIR